MMLTRLRRGLLWISRAKYCRGFGIQSPWAYRFVRYVINEHWPYYAYEDLRRAFPRLSLRDRRLGELYLRLANHLQAAEVELIGPVSEAARAYLHAGCHAMVLREGRGMPHTQFAFAVIARESDLQQETMAMIARATDDAVLVVEGIHHDAVARKSWARILQDNRVRVSFDLYYCGILCFDRKKYKQHYKINF